MEKKPEPPKAPEPPPAVNTAPAEKPVTLEQFIAQAPAEMRGVLANAHREYVAKKTEMVSALTANKNCRFSKEQLEGMETDMLAGLMDLAKGAVVTPAPAVQGVFTGQAPAPAVNAGAKPEEPLAVPTVNDFIIKKQ